MNLRTSKLLTLLLPWLCVAAVTAASGCLSSKTPYDFMENWLIREDAVRPFAVPVDVIYVQDHLYVSMNELPKMLSAAHDAVGREKLSGFARVFSPLPLPRPASQLRQQPVPPPAWQLLLPLRPERPCLLLPARK